MNSLSSKDINEVIKTIDSGKQNMKQYANEKGISYQTLRRKISKYRDAHNIALPPNQQDNSRKAKLMRDWDALTKEIKSNVPNQILCQIKIVTNK